jgi:exosortase E/protease (VPEID-CTERM system)
LAVIALAELTWLAKRVEVLPTSYLSCLKGFPSIFVISLAVVTVLVWAFFRRKLLEVPNVQEFSCTPWRMILAHWITFASFFWLTLFLSEGEGVSSPSAAFWALAWIVTGLSAGVFWLLAIFPARSWLDLVRKNSSLVGIAIMSLAASWILGFLTYMAWEPLRGPTFLVVKWLLLTFGQDVVSRPADLLLGTTQFAVKIFPACAGYEGIGLISVFVGSYLWLFRDNLRFPQAFILAPCGILAIWLVNAVRITLLVLFGTYISPQIALGGFHSSTGWIGFLAVALITVAVSRAPPFLAIRPSEGKPKAQGHDPTAAYLAPLIALLALILFTGAFSTGFDWFYPVRVLGTAAALWFFWRSRVTRLHFASLWSGKAIGIGALVFVVWTGLEWAMGKADKSPILPDSLEETHAGFAAAWLMFRVLGSVITVPIAEELAFRGYVLRRLISSDFDQVSPRFAWRSFLLSSFLFGALHGRWVAGTVSGMFYAWAMYRRGRVGDAIMAHATTNALIAADVLLLGHWNLWN